MDPQPIITYQYRCTHFCRGGGTQRRKVYHWSDGTKSYTPWTNYHCGC